MKRPKHIDIERIRERNEGKIPIQTQVHNTVHTASECKNDGEENCMAACYSMRIFRIFVGSFVLVFACVYLLDTHTVGI